MKYSPWVNYYRLRQVNLDGNTYSTIVRIEVQKEGRASLYPNPVSSSATISLQSAATTVTTLALYDMQGKMLGNYFIPAGKQKYTLNTARLTWGTYMVQIWNNGQYIGKSTLVKMGN